MACRLPRARLFPTSQAAYANTGGNSDYSFDQSSLGSQILRIAYQEQNTDIKQSRIDGKFTFERRQHVRLRRGNPRHETHQLASGSNLTMGDWGVGDAGSVPDMVALLTPFSVSGFVRRLQSGRRSDWRLEGQCERSRPVGPGSRLPNWTESLRSGRSAAVQPRLQHRQHESRRHAGRIRAGRSQVQLGEMPREPGRSAAVTRQTDVESANLQSRSDGAAVAGRQRLPGRASHGSQTLVTDDGKLQQLAAEPRLRHRHLPIR